MTAGSTQSGRASVDRELPKGFSVGHWTDPVGRTGCTVVLAPDGAVGGVDVRGGAPGTLGTDGLRPGTVIERSHAVFAVEHDAHCIDAPIVAVAFTKNLGPRTGSKLPIDDLCIVYAR